jgi:hypothetical protein
MEERRRENRQDEKGTPLTRMAQWNHDWVRAHLPVLAAWVVLVRPSC